MIRLRFTATKHLPEYHCAEFSMYHGDILEVPGEKARQVLADFPDNFEEVREGVKATAAPKDKMVRTYNTKDGKRYACPVPGCGYVANSERGLKIHMTKAHS